MNFSILEKKFNLKDNFFNSLIVLNNVGNEHELMLTSSRSSPFVLKIYTTVLDAFEVLRK